MDKLKALREAMKAQQLAAYIQPVHDEYMGEYPPASNRRLEWLTGFSGSAGTVVVTQDKAALFTDGRYTIQAANETDAKLFEQHNSGTLPVEQWLAKTLKNGERVGYDSRLYTKNMVGRMQVVLDKQSIALVAVANVIDPLWKDRPAAPASAVVIQDMQHAGEAAADKRKRIGALVKEAGADVALISAPEAVCWLLNIRGRDVSNTPVVLAFALLEASGAVQLFLDAARCDESVRKHLGDVRLRATSELETALSELKGKRVLIDPQAVPLWFSTVLHKAGAEIVEGSDPCSLPKAMKNPVELQGIRDAHRRDGAAIAKCLRWIDAETAKRDVRETEVCDALLQFRQQSNMFIEPSFDTISGSGAHGAIVHYRVTPESDRVMRHGELLLLDSGGQYPDGTTDITRTLPIGQPTEEYKERFTRVLKGHIALATVMFPEGTSGSQLDALARQYLWQVGLDYDHGTGHGVGHCLSVHEGPQRISKRGGDVALKAGMILSNEPGYYKEGAYGIRIENLVVVIEQAAGADGRKFFGFETLTCAPIDTRLVNAAMLTPEEKQWLNGYHDWVYATLEKAIAPDDRAWLKTRCKALLI